MARLDLSPDLLRNAHARARRRVPSIPACFDAAMADSLASRLVRAMAVGMALYLQRRAEAAQVVDGKRAAAGDTDESSRPAA